MCKYCEDILTYENKDFEVSPKYGRAGISYEEDSDRYEINFELDDVVHMAGFYINYCPICGSKLS